MLLLRRAAAAHERDATVSRAKAVWFDVGFG